ncbi:hypothetical protein A3Q56_05816 [Intoshia linei]|uniref:Uncharacterized protein n=1 Tax=Intoshia linei TaxID=1819745 RepID=A0A177AWR8_9BILA|nr:hypothetical protein A3Q56_05816 [Intoshia linei]
MLNDQFKNCRQKVSENSSQINGIASHFNHLNCNIDKILSNLNNNTKNISELTNEYSQLKLQIKNKLTEYKKSVETCYQSYDDNNKNLHQECMNLKKKYNDLENSLEKNVINTKEYLEKIDEKMDSYYNANDRKLSDERSILTNNFKELRNYANQQHKSSLENDDRTYKLFLTKLEEYDQKVKDDINNMESKNFKIEEELFNKIDTSTINKIQDLNYTYNSNFTKFSNIVSLLERQIDVQTNNFNELLAVEMNKRRRSEKNLSDINSNLEKQIIMATSLVDKQINTEKVILMKNESNLNHTNQRMKILEENYDQIIDEKNKLPNIYETIQSNNEKIHEKYQNENSKSNLIQIENESHLNQPVFQKESNEPVKSDESHEHFETGNEHISSAQIKSKTPSNESVSEYFESPSKKNFNKSNEINASNLESKDTQQYDLKNMENVNQFSSDIQNGRDSYDDTDNINNIDTENIHEKYV